MLSVARVSAKLYIFTLLPSPSPITLKSLFICMYIVHAKAVVFAHWSGERKHTISSCDKGQTVRLTARDVGLIGGSAAPSLRHSVS